MARNLSFSTDGGAAQTVVPEEEGKLKVWNGSEWVNQRIMMVWEGSAWVVVWKVEDEPDPPVDPPGGGTYVISPYSTVISGIAGGNSYADFSTSPYRGKITAVKARISWGSLGSMSSNVYGRTSGSFFRSIAYDTQWAYRTIDHDLGSTAVSQFNSGSAYGYEIRPTSSYTPNIWMSRLQLVLTTSS